MPCEIILILIDQRSIYLLVLWPIRYSFISGSSLILCKWNHVMKNSSIYSSSLVPYSQLLLQSVDFRISLLELLLKLSTPSIHFFLKPQCISLYIVDSLIVDFSRIYRSNSLVVVEVETALYPVFRPLLWFAPNDRSRRTQSLHRSQH